MSGRSDTNIYQSVRVLIDSEYRNDQQDDPNDFKYDLDKPISRVSRVYVESVQIPYNFNPTRYLVIKSDLIGERRAYPTTHSKNQTTFSGPRRQV